MYMAMNRCEFLVQTALAGSGLLTAGSGSTLMADANGIRWTRRNGLFTGHQGLPHGGFKCLSMQNRN